MEITTLEEQLKNDLKELKEHLREKNGQGCVIE